MSRKGLVQMLYGHQLPYASQQKVRLFCSGKPAKLPCFCMGMLLMAALFMSFPAFAIDLFNSNKMVDAVENGSAEDARAALLHGFSVNERTLQRVPVVVLAARLNKPVVLKFLTDNNARLDVRDPSGATALTEAVNVGSENMVRILIEGGADPDHRGIADQTALMIAARRGFENIINYLIENDADISISDYTGRTALDLAQEKGFHTIVDRLRAAGS